MKYKGLANRVLGKSERQAITGIVEFDISPVDFEDEAVCIVTLPGASKQKIEVQKKNNQLPQERK